MTRSVHDVRDDDDCYCLRMNESVHDGDDGVNMSESATNDALHGNVLDMEWVQAWAQDLAQVLVLVLEKEWALELVQV
jgi:hypothetical protein